LASGEEAMTSNGGSRQTFRTDQFGQPYNLFLYNFLGTRRWLLGVPGNPRESPGGTGFTLEPCQGDCVNTEESPRNSTGKCRECQNIDGSQAERLLASRANRPRSVNVHTSVSEYLDIWMGYMV